MPRVLARLTAAVTLLVASFFASLARSQPPVEKPGNPPAKAPAANAQARGETGRISGRLVAPEGVSVPFKGFQLQATSRRDARQPQPPFVRVAASAEVDEEGRFTFANLPPGRYVIGSAAQQNMPLVANTSVPLDVQPGRTLDDVLLTITPCREGRGRVVDRETGLGIKNVKIDVYVTAEIEPSQFYQHSGPTVTTDEEGHFLAWLRPGRVHYVLSEVPVEYVPPPAESVDGRFTRASYGENPLIELHRAAVLEGIVVDDLGHAVPSAALEIERVPVAPLLGHLQSPPKQADRAGKFVVEQLEPSVPVVLRARSASAATLHPVTVVPARLNGPVRLVVSEKHGCRLSGQVVDRGGKPLPQARLLLNGTTQLRKVASEGQAELSKVRLRSTTEFAPGAVDGTFISDALYADDVYELQIAVLGHSGRQLDGIRVAAGKTHDLGRLVLDALVSIKGVVVDAAGKAVPHAELRVAMPANSVGPADRMLELESDETGTFELPPANNEGVLRVWARSGQHATDGPVSFFPDAIDGPLRIELSSQPGMRISAQVLDLQGRPVQASASVVCRWDHFLTQQGAGPGARFGFLPAWQQMKRAALGGATLDAKGDVLVEGLWPEEQYCLVVTADGYQEIRTANVSGEAGATVHLGRLTMRRENLEAAGEVVDTKGRPIDGATVYSLSDASRARSVVTDADGRFRLTGLLEGPLELLIRKQGYWPVGLHFAAGDTRQRAQLLSKQQPRPHTRLPARSGDAPLDRRELALKLLNELWLRRDEYDTRNDARFGVPSGSRGSRFGRTNAPQGGDVVRQMASLDYKQALKWSAVERGAFDEIVRIRAFDQIVHDDVAEAVAQAGAPGASDRLKWMAHRRLAAGARDEAIRLLEAALNANLANEMAIPAGDADLISRAQIGDLASAAGRDEWGRRLVTEAADRVEALGQDAGIQARAAVTAALARFDVPRAVRLWVLLPNPSGGIPADVHSELAALVGAYDLAAARRLMVRSPTTTGFRGFGQTRSAALSAPGRSLRTGLPRGNSPAADSSPANFEPVLRKVARRLAATNPEKALALLDEIDDAARLEKAEIMGRAALALAAQDAPRAYDLVDRALDGCFDHQQPTASALPSRIATRAPRTETRAQTAARIAVMAAEAGYPDMQAVIDQVLALRQPTASGQDAPPSAEAIEVAWLLAIIEAPVARELLNRASPREAAAGMYQDSDMIAQWLQAWVLIDVERAVELFHQILHEQKLSGEIVRSCLLPMIDSLCWSHDDFIRLALRQPSPAWFPYAGDEAVHRMTSQ